MSASARSVAVPARAKVNLDLRVTGTRPDGSHELITTMQAIDVHDLLEVERSDATSFTSTGFDIDDHANTVLKAQAAAEHATGRSLPARFHLQKRIPPGSGLGGASSDAAAAIHALAALYCLDLDMRAIAQDVGADVTFFLTGGAARVTGTGEMVTTAEPGAHSWFAIAWPGIELSTAAVYRGWDEVGGDGANELRRAAAHVEPRIEQFALTLGAGWQMTGSGSAFFQACATSDEAAEATRGLQCWTAVARAVGRWG